MLYKCKFNPSRDLKKVVPNACLDLAAAFANNAIPSVLAVDEGAFNEIDEPESIAGRVRDRIDAEVIDRQIKGYVPEGSNTE